MLRDLDDHKPGIDAEISLPATEYVKGVEKRSKSWSAVFLILAILTIAVILWKYYPAAVEQLHDRVSELKSDSQLENTVVLIPAGGEQSDKITDAVTEDRSQPQQRAIIKETNEVQSPSLVQTVEPELLSQPGNTQKNINDTDTSNVQANDVIELSEPTLPQKQSIASAVEDVHIEKYETISNVAQQERINPQMHIVERAELNEIQARKSLAKGERLMLNGVETEAVQAFKDALTLDSSLTEARERLVTFLLQQNDIDALEPWVEDGLSIDPYNNILVSARSRQFVERGDYEDAILLLNKTITAGHGDEALNASLAAIYQQTGDFSSSAKIYNQLLVENPGQAKWWLGFGISLENLGQRAAAIESYQRAINLEQLQPQLVEYTLQRLSSLSAM